MNLEYVYGQWGDDYKKLISQIPRGNYYDHRAEIVPKEDVSCFRLSTDAVGYVHYVRVIRESADTDEAKSSFTVVPTSKNFWVSIRLGKGLNTISIAQSKENYVVKSFVATYFGSILAGYAKELNGTSSKLSKIERDLYSDESTRALAPLLGFSKDLTDVHVLRTFGLQLIVRALVNQAGMMRGFENICRGIMLSTPRIENAEQRNIVFENLFAGQEYELGKLVRLWVRDPASVRRQYLLWLRTNAGEDIEYCDDSNVVADGESEFNSSDEPMMPEDVGVDSETGEVQDKEDEEGEVVEISLLRTDRNFPIPFTKTHPWTDREYVKREHLDSGTSLDIATMDDPFETGMLGERLVPLKADGEKASAITKIMSIDFVPTTSAIAVTSSQVAGIGIATEQRIPIATECASGEEPDILIKESALSENYNLLSSEQDSPLSSNPDEEGCGVITSEEGSKIAKDDRF